MFRILKWLIYLIILAGIGLTLYAYLGPILGVDFAPEQREITQPVVLEAE
jgi:hypothetical protein